MSTTYNCATCGLETDFTKRPSTKCSGCKKDFCFVVYSYCFAQHYDQCENPYACSIAYPELIVNLQNKREEQ
jgi:hypothetical protein